MVMARLADQEFRGKLGGEYNSPGGYGSEMGSWGTTLRLDRGLLEVESAQRW